MLKKNQPANNQPSHPNTTWQPSSRLNHPTQPLPQPAYMPPPAKPPNTPSQPSNNSLLPNSAITFAQQPHFPVAPHFTNQSPSTPSQQPINQAQPPITPTSPIQPATQWGGPKPSFIPQGVERLSKLDMEGNYPPFLTVSWTEWVNMYTTLIQDITRYQRALNENDPCSANRIALEMLGITTKMIEEAAARMEARA
jgi:hypothetical protein